MGGHVYFVKDCRSAICPLHDHRLLTGAAPPKKEIFKTIKAYCRQCVNWEDGEMGRCTMTDCPFYPYRLGRASAMREAKAKMSKSEQSVQGGSLDGKADNSNDHQKVSNDPTGH